MKGQRWARKHIARTVDYEIRKALKRSPNDLDLLSLKGSIGDTLTDAEVLRYLEDWKKSGKVLHERQ